MKIDVFLQTNSNFFYSKAFKQLDFLGLKGFNVPMNKLNSANLTTLLDSVIFAENYENSYILIDTDKGQFFMTTIFNELSHEKAKEILTANSTENECYYFSNVDYFAYGRFGIAEKGKITRYLAFNEEVEDEKDMVQWVGKAHKWEVETHTFYTKQKLIDYEMEFATDEVCEMIEYYLPFYADDLKINSIQVFTAHDIILETLENMFSVSPKILSPIDIKHTKDTLKKYNFNEAYIKIYKYALHYTFSCNFMNVYQSSGNVFESKVLHLKIFQTHNKDKFTYEVFKGLMSHITHQMKYASYLDFDNAVQASEEVLDNQNFREAIIILKIEPDNSLSISLDTGRFFVKAINQKFSFFRRVISFGNKLDNESFEKLYNKIIKLKV